MNSNGEKKPEKKYSRLSDAVERRKRAAKRLENQLLTGFKNVKDPETGEIGSAPLTEGDIKRIRKELDTLTKRV